VRDHDDGHAEGFLDFDEKVHDVFAGGGIEIAGGLIGKKNFRTIDERAGDGGALLFAAGKFGGTVGRALIEFDALQGFGDARVTLSVIYFREAKGKLDVFCEGHAREKIERLKDHADGVAAVACEFEGRQGGKIFSVGVNRARGRPIEASHEIEKSGFAGAGAAKECDEFAGADGEGDIVYGANGGGAEGIVAGDVVELEGDGIGWARSCGHVNVGCALREYYVGAGKLCQRQGVHPGCFCKECASD